MVAAVQCGADAVYLGAGEFNARRGAENFGGELEAAVGYCHARGAKAYVTLNTMVRQDELSRLEATIEEICRAGADGAIVADFGVARALRQMAPSLPLHASTQMAVHNRQGVDFLVENGFARVVLAREMRYEEIARCAGRGAELEVFVHGALCVSCSGQCLLSSMIGGRSGNRGLCAQPCRMKYKLDGHEGYLLSTKDLCSLDGLEALVQAGADSLKIEGRLKRPEYVAQTTAAYRAALDALERGDAFDADAARAEMKQMFNRGGFTRGYGFGVDDGELMYSARPNHLGVEIGACRRSGEVELRAEVDGRDALVLRRDGGEDRPVHPGALPAGRARIPEARPGDRLVRLVSQAQLRAVQERFLGERRKTPIDAKLRLRVGAPAELALSDGTHAVAVEGEAVQRAQSRPADPARIRAQVEKLGDAPFALRNYSAEIDEDAYLPVSALNALRRRGVEALIEARFGPAHPCAAMELPPEGKNMPEAEEKRMPLPEGKRTPEAAEKRMPEAEHSTVVNAWASAPEGRGAANASGGAPRNRAELSAQSGDPDVLRRALGAGADRAVFAPLDLRPEALAAMPARLPAQFDLALPPVMGEETLRGVHAWARENAPRIRRVYLSNVGQFALSWPGELAGDLHLNAANALTLAQLADWGARIYAPSVELNRAQIEALGGRKSLAVYGALPLMQLRHCPLRAAAGAKGPHAGCHRCDACAPGERIDAKALTDRTGARFPLRRVATPEGCVVQLLNSAKLMLLRRVSSLPAAADWRLMLDGSDPVEAVVRLHRLALDGGDCRADADWPLLCEMNTTTGHYFRGAE